MNDKRYAAQKQRVKQYFDKWQERMGLRWWHIDLTWDRSYSSGHRAIAASTDYHDWHYRRGGITFYLPNVEELKDEEEVEKLVIHELAHILVAPMACNLEDKDNEYARQIMEFNTEIVANALWWTMKGEQENAKV